MSTISLVTGANRGIGREVCRQLAELGHTVILTARDPGAAAEAAQAVRAEPMRLDVTDRASVADAADWTRQRYGKLDVLVNNAAITYDTWQRAVTADLTVVREAAETNLYGPWLMVQEFLPLLRNSDHPRIVNVSSEAASLAGMGGGTPAYTASKVALNALTRMLADDCAGTGSWSTRSAPAGSPPTWAVRAEDPWPRARPALSGRPPCPTPGRPAACSAMAARCPGNERQACLRRTRNRTDTW
jgi:NAD(P)-dependent dehydrogenase (short-subunit alcohol dehydrogenase family)